MVLGKRLRVDLAAVRLFTDWILNKQIYFNISVSILSELLTICIHDETRDVSLSKPWGPQVGGNNGMLSQNITKRFYAMITAHLYIKQIGTTILWL